MKPAQKTCKACGGRLTAKIAGLLAKKMFCTYECQQKANSVRQHKRRILKAYPKPKCTLKGCHREAAMNGICAMHLRLFPEPKQCARCERRFITPGSMCPSCTEEAEQVARITARRGTLEVKPTPWDQAPGVEWWGGQ